MAKEILLILIFAAATVTFALVRRSREKEREEMVRQVIICEVTYRDREKTTDFLDAYFESNLISVLSVNCFVEGGEDVDLYTNVYKLFLPGNLAPAQLVGHLSACNTVQSVHTKTE